jgi:hypothetical protein
VLVKTLVPLGTCALAFTSFSFGVLILKRSVFEDHQPTRTTAAALVSPASSKTSEDSLDKKFSTATEQPASKALVTAP